MASPAKLIFLSLMVVAMFAFSGAVSEPQRHHRPVPSPAPSVPTPAHPPVNPPSPARDLPPPSQSPSSSPPPSISMPPSQSPSATAAAAPPPSSIFITVALAIVGVVSYVCH
ncbi:hypothetical protein B296_00058745 [Ensete ventricosum]|uniref:Uncharacterized protein n=1 Tax=Ensete ventricosum TaxID=4639 RepID=A0A426XHY7_ENSVE|nr:hypothetical protein B296_00058745 [Ensete ventricosum]